jgi:hypothetical protein
MFYPDWTLIVNRQLLDHEERIVSMEAILEQATPADGDDYTYDLRTYPERTEARLEDYQRRIAVLEANVRHLEYLVHRLVNHAKQAAEDV